MGHNILDNFNHWDVFIRIIVTIKMDSQMGLPHDIAVGGHPHSRSNSNSSSSSLGSMSQVEESIREAMMENKTSLCSATPLTRVGKRKQMIKMLTLALMPIVVLIILAVSDLIAVVTKSIDAVEIRRNVRFSRQVRSL